MTQSTPLTAPIQRLALGTVQFGLKYGVANAAGQVSTDEAQAILKTARAGGMDTLDTAIAYGESEAALGAQGVNGWKVVTKLPTMPAEVQTDAKVHTWVQSQIQGSLTRLGLESVYAVLLHRPDQLLGAQGPALISALEQLKRRGWASKTGVSIYDPQELEALTQACTLDLVQAPMNLLDTRLVESGWATRLKSAGTEIHVRSAFLQGLLLMSPAERPEKFARWAPLWLQWHGWLRQHQLTPLQACLRYSLSVLQADRVLVGVDSARQLSEILKAAQGVLPPLPQWNMPVDADLVNPARWSQS